MIKAEKVFAITYDKEYERSGEPAEIIGVKMVTKFKKTTLTLGFTMSKVAPELCYVIEFQDGDIDYIPQKEIHTEKWHIATLQELLIVGMP